MVRILSPLLGSNTGRGSCTVMTISHIESLNIAAEQPGDLVDGLVVVDDPELVAEVILIHEVIFRLPQDGLGDDLVQDVVVLVGEEHRLDVGVLDADMDHAVVLFVLAGELMLLDLSGSIVVGVGAEHETVLGAAFHCLGIDIIALLGIPAEPSLSLPGLEVLDSLGIDLRIMIFEHRLEINLGFGDMEKGLLTGHFLGLGGVQHIVRRSRYFGDNIFRRTDRRKGFYSYHNDITC